MVMDVEDSAGLKGRVEIFSRPADSNDEDDWEQIVDETNIVPDVGLDKYKNLLLGNTDDRVDSWHLGIDGTAESSSDTALGNEKYEERWGSRISNGTGSLRYEGSLESIDPPAQPFDFAELGVKFEDGTLASRITFTPQTKDSTQEWRIRYTLTITNA